METLKKTFDEKTNTDTFLLQGERSISTQFKKFQQFQWKQVEVAFNDPLTLAVLDTMKVLGNEKAQLNERKNNIKICGEIYDIIRPILVKKGLVSENLIKKEIENNKKK